MTPTLRNLVREMLREADDRHAMILALNDLDAQIDMLIYQAHKVDAKADAVENPGTDPAAYELLGKLYGELETISSQIRALGQKRDALNWELTGYGPRPRRGS